MDNRKMMILGVIPARMAATRFPNKPMALIEGIPMIGHCYFRSKLCDRLDELYVATCDQEIVDYMENDIRGKAILTSPTHERASERAAEALVKIEELLDTRFDIVVMIQGDEPLVDPGMLSEVIEPLLDGGKMVSNLMAFLPTQEDRDNPNHVKVVTDNDNNAMYMSRESIPSRQKYDGEIDTFRQLGLIAFTREALLKFVSLKPTLLEIVESVDMNRFLEHRIPVHMVTTKFFADSVDTPDDLTRVEEKMKMDSIFQKYKHQL